MAYYVYLIAGVVCCICEVFTMDFSLLCFGLGLFGAGAASWLGLGLGWQVIIFLALSLGLFVGIRPLALKHLYHKSKNVKTNVQALIGRVVTVLEAPDPKDHIGRVLTDGDNWRAHFAAPAQKGEDVRVEKVDGNTLFVKKKKKQEEGK